MNMAAFIGVLLAGSFLTSIAAAEDSDYNTKTIEVGRFKKIKDIQTAIYQSKPGDVIVVSPGTYEDYTPKPGVTVKEAQTGTVHIVPEDPGFQDNGSGSADDGGLGPEAGFTMDNPGCDINTIVQGMGGSSSAISTVGAIANGATQVGLAIATGGLSIALSGVKSLFGGGGGRASEKMQKAQQTQLFFQSLCDAHMAAIQAKIIAKGEYDTQGDMRRGMRRVNKLVENVQDLPWDDMYPKTYGDVDQQSQIIWRNVEVKRQYDAGMTSKKTAGEAVAALNELPDRTTGLITATQNAEGPTAVGQAHVQATMMGVEVQSIALSNQIAHQQVVEAHLDKQTAAERRAVEYRARQRRGLPGYEGDGGLGLLMAEDN